MRPLLVATAALMLAPAAWAGSGTALKITVWPHGKNGVHTTWTVRCGPPGGTHPNPTAACRALRRHPGALRPVPRNRACTQQWDGPQIALARGTFRGHRVRSWFNRTNGCEIDRWNALAPIFRISD